MATTGKMPSLAPILLLLLVLPAYVMGNLRAADDMEKDNSEFGLSKAAQMRQHSLLVLDNGARPTKSGAPRRPNVGRSPKENLSRPARLTSPESPPSPPPPLMQENGCNFGGRWLRVAVSQQPPLVSCLQDLYGDWLCNGSNVEVIQLLERKFNFRAEWVVLAQQPFVSSADATSNSSSNQAKGALGLVASGRAWLGANGVMRTRYRSEMAGITLSEPFDSFRYHFLLSKWVRDHDHIFIKPFAADTWLALLLSSLLIVPALYLVNSTSSYYLERDHRYVSELSLAACLNYRVRQFRRWLLRMLCCNYCCCSLLTCAYCRGGRQRNRDDDESCSSTNNDSGLDEQVTQMLGTMLPFMENKSRANNELAARRRHERRRKRRLRTQWRIERRRARRLAKTKRRSGFFRLAYVFWYVAGSLAAQGGEEEELPAANSCRVLVAAWWLYLIVVVSFHSGVLTAILTFPKQIDFIQTLDDFLALHSAGLSMRLWVDGHSELSHLLQSPDELFQSPLYELVEAVGGQHDAGAHKQQQQQQQQHAGIRRVDFGRHRQRVLDDVMSGQAAYLEERSTIQLVITQEYFDQRPPRCHFKASRQPIDIVPMSLALSSHLPPVCIARINQLLKHIMRTGLAQKWRRKYDPQGNDCLQTMLINAGDVETIRLRQVMLAFWLLAAGLMLGALLLILEVVWLFTADMDSSSSSGSSSTPSSSYEENEEDKANERETRFRKTSRRSGLSKKTEAKGRKRHRARRLQKTVELMNRLREGKIYSEFFAKVSGDVRARARRASQAIVAPFVQGGGGGAGAAAGGRELGGASLARGGGGGDGPIRRRRALRPRVAPTNELD